jgi:hypothetical protein
VEKVRKKADVKTDKKANVKTDRFLFLKKNAKKHQFTRCVNKNKLKRYTYERKSHTATRNVSRV